MNNKFRDFKLSKDNIGDYIVWKMQATTKYYFDSSSAFGIRMTGIKGDPVMWVVCQIDWYNKELFKDNEYKSYMHPVGDYMKYFTDRPWYNCDIEHRLYHEDAFYFKDLDEAWKFAQQKNEELLDFETEGLTDF